MKDIYKYLLLDTKFQINKFNLYNASGIPKNNISRFISNYIFKPNKVKLYLKNILPSTIRYNIKTWLSGKLFQKQVLSDRYKLHLKKLFINDILNLSKLINRDLSHWLR